MSQSDILTNWLLSSTGPIGDAMVEVAGATLASDWYWAPKKNVPVNRVGDSCWSISARYWSTRCWTSAGGFAAIALLK